MAAAGAGAGVAGAAAGAAAQPVAMAKPAAAAAAATAAAAAAPEQKKRLRIPRGMRWWVGFLHIASAVTGIIFAVLCYFVWADFDRITLAVETERMVRGAADAGGNSTSVAPMFNYSAYIELFTGAAVSAGFCVVGVSAFALLSSVPMWCGLGKTISGPKRKFWRGMIVGASLNLSFMLFAVAQQFMSYGALARGLSDYVDGNFDVTLLQSAYCFGFISGIFTLVFGVALFFHRTPEVKKTTTW